MELKTEIFKRVPPGDRWVEIGGNTDTLFSSLTEALEHYFQKTRTRQYYIDAGAGYVYRVEEVDEPTPEPMRYSLYGEEY
jgi:hypothetical protein